VGGGCINNASTISDGSHTFFVKTNQAESLAMFAAEAEGLKEIAASKSIRVPHLIAYGQHQANAYLILEYIPLRSGSIRSQRLLGEQLAKMHGKTQAQFGWRRNNTIGSTPQINTLNDNWVQFWAQHRLGFQLELAARNGYRGELQHKGETCLQNLPQWLAGYQPPASLLHGDLWSGNIAFDTAAHPVLYDPAVYFGDREADLAMTELFGGLSQDFYAAYREHWPLDDGYRWRKTLYNLYHIINHLNLFGGAYRDQAIQMMNTLLKELA
jgi:fructosamine-3-kinase